MNQRPGKRRTIHTYSSNVSRNSIYLINQQQKRRKEKTLRMLKKDIIEKSFTSSKAIERVSPNIHPITPESRGWISVLLSIDPKPVPNDLIRCFYTGKFYFSSLVQLFRRVWFDILETEAAGFDIWTLWFVPYNFKLRWRITNLIKRDEILL